MNTHHASRTPPHVPRLLIGTLLIAAFLRLWQIGTLPPGLHYDEAADTIIAEQIARGESAPIFIEAYTGKEVLFFYWAAAWMKLIGPSAFAMRLAAALLGVLTVAATYRAMAEIFGPDPHPTLSRKGRGYVALLAAIFIATSFWHILMSRLGFRSISEPLIQALALAAVFRGLRLNRTRWFVVAGVFVGLNLYTYLAARLFPIGIALIFLYFVAFDRGHRLDRVTQLVVTVASAVIVFLPLGVYFVQHPAAFLTRIQQVAPRGDQFAPLLENVLRALGMFFIEGDPYIRFNLPGRPLFPVVLGALFLVGVIGVLVGMFRGRTVQRRGAYFSLIALTLIMLLPTALAVNEITPSNLRAIGLMPMVFVFPALGTWWLGKSIWTRITRMNTDYKDRIVFIRGAVVLVLIATAVEASTTYFGQYVSEPQLYIQSDGDLAAISAVLNQAKSDGSVYIAALHYRHPTVAALAEKYSEFKWLSGNRVVVLPDSPVNLYFARLALPDEAWLKRFLPDSALMAAPLAPDGQTNYRAYHLDTQPMIEPQIKLNVNYGNIIQLMGYDREDLPKAGLSSSQSNTLGVTLYWRVLNKADRGDYSTFAQLRDAWGFEWGQTGSFDYPSEEWSPGEIIINRLDVPIAAGAPPGDYELRVGLFSQSANARLNIVAADGGFGGTVAQLTPLAWDQLTTDAVQLNIGTRVDQEVVPGLKLLGYSIETTSAKQGAPLGFTLFWQSTARLSDESIKLELASCGCALQPKTTTPLTTTRPVHNAYPFDQWTAGEIVADRYRLRSPIDLTSGDYTLKVAVGASEPIELGTLNLYQGDRVMDEPAIEHRVNALFGEAIELVGYTLDRGTDAIGLTLIWRAVRVIDQDYTVFTHALDATGKQIGGQDNQPLQGAYPTSWWIPGEYIRDTYTLPLADAIEIGLYDPETGARLGETLRLR
ncbi:MAG: glycosyltransferase family 39 protein [Thermoflexales bacterium]|nr:glycosyltransferase family 39 protein [Thermoflexales bacterium]